MDSTRLAAQMDRLVQVILAIGIVLWHGMTRVRGGPVRPGKLLLMRYYDLQAVRPFGPLTCAVLAWGTARTGGTRQRILWWGCDRGPCRSMPTLRWHMLSFQSQDDPDRH